MRGVVGYLVGRDFDSIGEVELIRVVPEPTPAYQEKLRGAATYRIKAGVC
ncbi:MAG: hypothetical protein HYX72_07625 [Acidobacteria bacterium]|nr:hypothetical protein [Acidobacteriota bacterium]